MGFIAKDMSNGYKPKNQNIDKLKQFLKKQAKNELPKK